MKRKIVVGLQICFATVLTLFATVFAATIGTEEDPLVAKSYVDDRFNQLVTLINSINGGTPSADTNTNTNTNTAVDTEAIVNQVLEQLNDQTGGSVAVETPGYVPVSVAVGQTILGDEGTELILRAGKGNVYIEGVDGIVDATDGKNLKNGATATMNHIMIVPRNDGRGVKVTEAAWFLVKGGYTIK